jgi:hypothetical protein
LHTPAPATVFKSKSKTTFEGKSGGILGYAGFPERQLIPHHGIEDY